MVATLLVMGPGAAFADESAPAAAETAAPAPAPVEEPPPAPVEEPADEAPAPAPVDEPAGEAPAPSTTPAETPEEPAAPAEEPADADADAEAPADEPAKVNLVDSIIAKAFAALEVAEAAIAVPCIAGPVDPADIVGDFEIDGDLCAKANLDWDTHGMYGEDGLADGTAFAGGNSEGDDPSNWAGGGPAAKNKNDIGDVWAYSHVFDTQVWAFFGLTNDSTSGGTGQYDVEYNQQDNIAQGGITVPNRTPGDLMFRFTSTGSDPLTFDDAKKWVQESDDAWDDTDCELIVVDPVGDEDFGWCTIPKPAGSFEEQTSADGTFFEGALNISVLVGEGNCSGNFGVVQFRSVTGNSFYTSALKDYVAPLGVDTPSTCGSIVINKEDVGGTKLGGATFSVSPNPDPEAVDPNAPYSITDNDANDANDADGIIEINPATPGDYTVTETDAPDGYLLPIPATQGPISAAEGDPAVFTFVDPKQWEALTAEKSAEATYTAEYFWSIVKEISATGDAPWSSSTTADSPLTTTVPADADPTTEPFFYRLKVAEEGEPDTSDYVVSGVISVTNPNDEAVEADISDSLPGAECLVENEETLTVDVPADAETDYSYVCTFAGTPEDLEGENTATVSWDISDYPQEDGDQIKAGDYTITPKADYAFGAETTSINKTVVITDDHHVFDPEWSITYGDEDDGEYVSDVYEIELSAPAGACSTVLENKAAVIGDEKVVLDDDSAFAKLCTELPTLTLEKVVVNGKGGEAVPADWDLTATPDQIEDQDAVTGNGDPTDDGGVSDEPVRPGDYTLSESGLDGYSQVGGWDCGDAEVNGNVVTIEYGDADVTCTVTNQQDAVWEIAKSSVPASGTVEPGAEITYTLTATLLAGVPALDIDITDDYSGLVGKTSEVTIDDPNVTMNGDNTFTWHIDSLSDVVTLDYTVTVNADALGVELVNLITAPGSNCPPPVIDDIVDERAAVTTPDECTVVHQTPHWLLSKSSVPETGAAIVPNSIVTYTLTAFNDSDADVLGAVVTDDLSKVLDTATITKAPDPAVASIDGTTLTWNVPDLGPGESATLTYAVTVNQVALTPTDVAQQLRLLNVAITESPTGECVTVDGCTTGHGGVVLPPDAPTCEDVDAVNFGDDPPCLPNTGGPDQRLLVAGLGMLLAGLVLVLGGRRRRA